MKALTTTALLMLGIGVYAQNIDSDGNWRDTGTWQLGVVADDNTDNVTMDNNLPGTGTVTIQDGETFAIGTINMGSGNTLTIESDGGGGGASFTVGIDPMPNTTVVFTTNNSTTININGDLTINGKLLMNNNLILNVTGTLTITGDVELKNGGSLDISGAASIGGDVDAGTGTGINVGRSLNITGNIDAGNNSTLTGSGTVTVGSCTGDPGVCNDSQLPITLLHFSANVEKGNVILDWATVYEENNDYFTLQRSVNGYDFDIVAKINGAGNSNKIVNYSYTDDTPYQGVSYYRLVQTDYDGTSTTFDVLSVNVTYAIDRFHLIQNLQTAGRVKIQNNHGDICKVSIFDIRGGLMYRSNIQSGENTLDTKELGMQKGIYIVRISDIPEQQVFSSRIIVQ